jgi:hypothetical protein
MLTLVLSTLVAAVPGQTMTPAQAAICSSQPPAQVFQLMSDDHHPSTPRHHPQ